MHHHYMPGFPAAELRVFLVTGAGFWYNHPRTRTGGDRYEENAVITGASSGMGRRFAETVDTFDRFDEVWVIARHEKALEELRDRVPYPIRALALDLTDRRSFQTYADALAEEKCRPAPEHRQGGGCPTRPVCLRNKIRKARQFYGNCRAFFGRNGKFFLRGERISGIIP